VLGRVDYQSSSKHAMFARFMNIRYKLPYYFDGKNALTTPSNTLDNLGRSMVLSDSYTSRPPSSTAFRVTTIRSGNLRGASPFKSPADMGLNLTNTPLTGHYTELASPMRSTSAAGQQQRGVQLHDAAVRRRRGYRPRCASDRVRRRLQPPGRTGLQHPVLERHLLV
jgi:hypothetical protein